MINPDEHDSSVAPNFISLPENTFNGTWTNIKNAYSRPEEVPSFNHGHMISYFVSRTAADGLASGDVKSINKSAKYLYDCGHIQCMEKLATQVHQCILEQRASQR